MNGPLPFWARLTNPHGAAHRSVNASPSVIVAGSAVKLVIGCGALAVQAATAGAGVGVGVTGAGCVGGPLLHDTATSAPHTASRRLAL